MKLAALKNFLGHIKKNPLFSIFHSFEMYVVYQYSDTTNTVQLLETLGLGNFKTWCKKEESPGQFFNFINSRDH